MGAGQSGEFEWKGWVLANEDVYVVPLVPFLSRMGDAEFEGGRREAQLHSLELVLMALSGGVLGTLRESPSQLLVREVGAPGAREEVVTFLQDLHHKIVFGNWLSPNLDYDDKVNYVRWFLVMCGAQVAQVLELLLTGSSARWRLNRLVNDLSDVLSGCQHCSKQDLTSAMTSGVRGGGAGAGGAGGSGALLNSSGANAAASGASLSASGGQVFCNGDEVVECQTVAAAATTTRPGGGSLSTSTKGRLGVVVGDAVLDPLAGGGARVMVRFGLPTAASTSARSQCVVEQKDVAALEHSAPSHASFREKKERSPWAAPVASYELMLLLRLAFACGQGLSALHTALLDARRKRRSGKGASEQALRSVPTPAWNVRWAADMRNWLFAAIVASILKSAFLRSYLNTYIAWTFLLAFVFFHRYPSLWFQFSSGRWLDAAIESFD